MEATTAADLLGELNAIVGVVSRERAVDPSHSKASTPTMNVTASLDSKADNAEMAVKEIETMDSAVSQPSLEEIQKTSDCAINEHADESEESTRKVAERDEINEASRQVFNVSGADLYSSLVVEEKKVDSELQDSILVKNEDDMVDESAPTSVLPMEPDEKSEASNEQSIASLYIRT